MPHCFLDAFLSILRNVGDELRLLIWQVSFPGIIPFLFFGWSICRACKGPLKSLPFALRRSCFLSRAHLARSWKGPPSSFFQREVGDATFLGNELGIPFSGVDI